MARLLVVLSLTAALYFTGSMAIECYDCETTLNFENIEEGHKSVDDKSCFSLEDTNTLTASARCFTTYEMTGSTVKITRGGEQSGENSTDFCTTGLYGKGKTCYCTGDKCNSETLAAPRTFECYECTTVDYFDNGCGMEFQPSAKYMKKVAGCSACGKTVKLKGDYAYEVSRGCVRSVHTKDMCLHGDTEKFCVCEGALCNSAQSLKLTAFTFISTIALSAVKFSF